MACGITVGTPVRIRGVPVGGVLAVQPSLERVDVLVEIRDSSTVIPRNSLIEANQSGLISEPLIDITPQPPIPEYKGARRLCAGRLGALLTPHPPPARRAPEQTRSPPRPPPAPTVNPLDEACEEEGKVVCHQGRIRGFRGADRGGAGARSRGARLPGTPPDADGSTCFRNCKGPKAEHGERLGLHGCVAWRGNALPPLGTSTARRRGHG